MVEKKRKARDGKIFFEVYLGRGRAVITSGDRKEILDGPFSIRAVETKKFGLELQHKIYGPKGEERVETRNPSDWNRYELILSLSESNLDKIAGEFEKMAKKLRELKQRIKSDVSL